MDKCPIEQIKDCINKQQNFLLSGGAGSGKTYTLGEVLKYIYSLNGNTNVACITYTNVAADEIKERFPFYNNLRVSTIHDFLWDNIKQYQKNLQTTLYNLIKENNREIKLKEDIEISEDYFSDKQIQYREYSKISEGIISHNEVIVIANRMFDVYPLLVNIIKDKYEYILIDEYQDTDKKVIEIFLDYLQRDSNKQNIIGLFGDSMQSIYDNKGVGDIKEYIEKGIVKEILKQDNYRCSRNVINLINKIRDDNIKQLPARKNGRGEIINKEGSIKFLYSTIMDINKLKGNAIFENWDFNNSRETKELYLTRKLIAKQGGFENLWNKYKYKDNLIGDSKDKLIKHLSSIKELLDLYNDKKYREVIRKISFKIKKTSDKSVLKKKVDKLNNNLENKTIDFIINEADELHLIKKDEAIVQFIKENEESYELIKELLFAEIIALNEFEQEKTPFSTQHGVKGAEFENVLIILDNGNWNQYNFKVLFENSGSESIKMRTKKIFYVCCSRAINNLVVYAERPTEKMLATARDWFGVENVISVD